MKWVQFASHLLTAVDTGLGKTYFDAINEIKTVDDLAFYDNAIFPAIASPYIFNEEGLFPLHYAIKTENHVAFDWILNIPGFPVNLTTKNHLFSPVHMAVQHENIEFLNKLVTSPSININGIDANGQTALSLAIEQRNLQLVKILTSSSKINLNLSSSTSSSTSYLHLLAHENTLEFLEHILKLKLVDVNIVDKESKTALILAVQDNQIEVVKLLLKYEARVDIIDDYGRMAIHYAVENNNSSMLSMLLYFKNSLDNDNNDASGMNNNNISFKRALAQSTLLYQDQTGHTPLMIAICKGFVKIANAIISLNIDVSQQDSNKNSLLHLAVLSNTKSSPEIVSILLKYSKSFAVFNADNKTPYDLANELNRKDLKDMLLDIFDNETVFI